MAEEEKRKVTKVPVVGKKFDAASSLILNSLSSFNEKWFHICFVGNMAAEVQIENNVWS